MAMLNHSGEEISAKIVYYGPGLSGKTTNLEFIHAKIPSRAMGRMVSMKTRTDRTLFFDFLPLDTDAVDGRPIRFLLYTVPGQVYYNATRKLVLNDVDAIVFVADSSRAKLAENIESLRNLEDNLNELGLSLDHIPWVLQYNKRDLDDAMSVTELEGQLNLLGVPAFEATANVGAGVDETLLGVADALLRNLNERLARGEVIDRLSPGEDPVARGIAEDTGRATGVRAPAPAPASPPQPSEAAPQPPAEDTEPAGCDSDAFDAVVDDALREVNARAPQPVEARVEPPKQQEREPDTVGVATESSKRAPTGPASRSVEEPSRAATREAPPPQATGERAPAPHTSPEPAPTPPQTPEEPMFHEIDEPPMDNDLGRTVEFEEAAAGSEAVRDSTPQEFITDPMGSAPPPAEEPEPPPEANLERGQGVDVTVPVVISRSQVRKSLPIRLNLEIHVVDD